MGRQDESHDAAALARLERERATVQARDPLSDEQPDAEVAGLRPGHQMHDRRRVLRFEAGARVLDDQRDHPAVARLETHPYLTIFGARLERIHPEGDPSEGGRRSMGVMVNYLYDPDSLEFNHERYVETGDVSVARALAGETKRVQAAWNGS